MAREVEHEGRVQCRGDYAGAGVSDAAKPTPRDYLRNWLQGGSRYVLSLGWALRGKTGA